MPKPEQRADAAVTRAASVLVPRFNMMSLAALLEPMRIANYVSPQPLYRWEYLSADGGEMSASNGMLQATSSLAEASDPALVFVCGSWGAEQPQRHTLGATTDNIPADLRAAVRLIEDSIEEPLSVPEVAARVGIS